MKKMLFIAALTIGFGLFANAQRVSVHLSFPVGIAVGMPGPAPFAGAIWIGPEWRWQRGHYVAVPGYWARPYRHKSVYVPGYWTPGRRGYVWVPGHWR